MTTQIQEFDIANDSEFVVIQEAAQQIENANDPDFAIYNILSICSRLMGLNRGRVFLQEAESESLYAAYGYGLTQDEIERSRFGTKEGITGKVMHLGRAVVVPDIDEEADYLFRTVDRETLPQEPVSFLAVPIIRKNKRIGVLTFNRLKNRKRSFDRDLSFLKILSLFIGEILAVHQMLERQTLVLKQENEQLRNVALGQGSQYGIIGESPLLLQALDKASRAANTPVTVILKGESGTGKEKFSRMIHRASNRKDNPFIAINCAAIPAELLEAELFGYEKGSFTGATQQKKGKFELANRGTLFLDEIGDLDFALQAKLLRVLEDKAITRIGGTQDIPIDVRVIVASHKDLYKSVNEGSFRLDLFYRFNVFPIELPALRDRHGDIRTLIRHFLNQTNQDYLTNAILEPEAITFLETYSWPGNIRQLENVIKRSVLLAEDDKFVTLGLVQKIIHEESAISHNTSLSTTTLVSETAVSTASQSLASNWEATPRNGTTGGFTAYPSEDERMENWQGNDGKRAYWKVSDDEKENLMMALKQARGNKTRAAMLLNMTPRQFGYRMSKLGIDI